MYLLANIYCYTVYGQTVSIESTFIVVPIHIWRSVFISINIIAIFRATITWYLPTWNCPKKALLL